MIRFFSIENASEIIDDIMHRNQFKQIFRFI